jgi:hypothetical protein
MFVAFCPLHGCDVLLSISCIRDVANLAPGVIAVELECYDGERLVVLTGTQTSRRGA